MMYRWKVITNLEHLTAPGSYRPSGKSSREPGVPNSEAGGAVDVGRSEFKKGAGNKNSRTVEDWSEVPGVCLEGIENEKEGWFGVTVVEVEPKRLGKKKLDVEDVALGWDKVKLLEGEEEEENRLCVCAELVGKVPPC